MPATPEGLRGIAVLYRIADTIETKNNGPASIGKGILLRVAVEIKHKNRKSHASDAQVKNEIDEYIRLLQRVPSDDSTKEDADTYAAELVTLSQKLA